MKFTGERLIMDEDYMTDLNHSKRKVTHLARYIWAKKRIKGSVLDVSCGTGYGTDILGASGADIDEESIKYAKKHFKCPFQLCDLEKDFPKGSWDTVVSFETIEHLENPHNFLKNCGRYKFIFSIPIDHPGEFHKVVYSRQEAKNLIHKYFKNVVWYEQSLESIEPDKGTGKTLIGIAQ